MDDEFIQIFSFSSLLICVAYPWSHQACIVIKVKFNLRSWLSEVATETLKPGDAVAFSKRAPEFV